MTSSIGAGRKAIYLSTARIVELLSQIDALLENPNAENADALFKSINGFHDRGVSDIEAYTWFMTVVEWAWMSGTTPMEDW